MIKVVCGLGNPGNKYRATRHNLGFDIVDRLAARHKVIQSGQGGSFLYRSVRTVTGEVFLIKPQTYMNRSGAAVAEALQLFTAQPTELFVIGDDFNLPLGRLRIRKSGSAGGHNGLASIIETLGHDDFLRLRGGIGPLPERTGQIPGAITAFVLSRFLPEEEKNIVTTISRSVEAIELILSNQIDRAISIYNSANPTPKN